MSETYECKTCGVVSKQEQQLCSPEKRYVRDEYCGVSESHSKICDSVKEHLPFVCGNCGRPAEQAELLCKPEVLG